MTALRLLVPAASLAAILVCGSPVVAAGQAAGAEPSLARLKGELRKAAPRRLEPEAPVQLAVPFKSRVVQRVFVPTLEEHLHQTFDLNLLQRQSADWASRCCGLDLGRVFQYAETALREREVRKVREQIARELAAIDAARRAAPK